MTDFWRMMHHLFPGRGVRVVSHQGWPLRRAGCPVAKGLRLATPLLIWCLAASLLLAQSPTPDDWAQYNYDNRAWRAYQGSTRLSPDTVPQLVEKWRFPSRDSGASIGAVHATPIVVNGFVYAGSAAEGILYKISPSGKLVWQFEVSEQEVKFAAEPTDDLPVPITEVGLIGWKIANSPLVTTDRVFLTTVCGQIFCLDRFTGKVRWSINTRRQPFPTAHLGNSFWSSPILVQDLLIVAGGALEQGLANDPSYPCCTGRGFIVALDPVAGDVRWTYVLGPEPKKLDPPIEMEHGVNGTVKYHFGPTTSTIWSTPSHDPESGLIYFGTDTNNSPRQLTDEDPRLYNKYSCAVIAIDAATGEERWVCQLVKNDVWHGAVRGWDPNTGQYKDVSIGDSPKVYDTEFERQRRKVVGVGCKNGGYYVIDRMTGDLLHHTTLYTGPPEPERTADAASGILAMPSTLGGLQTGCAFDGQRVYVNGIDWLGSVRGSLEGSVFLYPPSGGRVTAVRPNALSVYWRHERPQLPVPWMTDPAKLQISGDPVASGIAVAGGVCFFTTTVSGKLVAVRADSGELLTEIKLEEPVWCGPSVSRDRVYVGTGGIVLDFGILFSPEQYRFNFPLSREGAVYSFGLPGEDAVDRLEDEDRPVR
jgi:polyvinyl alcohol dehydrogenase (cytochrome)